MANVFFAARVAAATTLNVVTASATTVNVAVNAISDLATVASVHSGAWLEATKYDVEQNARARSIAGAHEARAAITDRLMAVQARLDADEAWAEMYAKVGQELTELTPTKKATLPTPVALKDAA